MDQLRAAYKTKADMFCTLIDRHFPQLDYQKPQGGMFVYGRLEGVDTKSLVYEALKHNMVFVPDEEFYDTHPNKEELRLNFTRATTQQMEKGLKILASLIQASH